MLNEAPEMESVNAWLGFARRSDIVDDKERNGLLRIETRMASTETEALLERHDCSLIDLSVFEGQPPALATMGFDRMDLSVKERLQSELKAVRNAGCLSRDSAKAIRREMQGSSFKLASGKRLKILYIAPEGFVMRRAGPNGLNPYPGETVSEMNGHQGATMVHGDQDVYGTPLKQIMKGVAPWLFRHHTPDGSNRFSPLFLLNIWMPLQQCTQPLTLVDRRTVDSRRQQVRYALPTDSFLDRDEEKRFNDIWLYLHDEAQQWYFDSSMDLGSAYVFDTLGEAHGAATLPGEDVAESLFCCLQRAIEAVDRRDQESLTSAINRPTDNLPVDTPGSLRRAICSLSSLFEEARNNSLDVLHDGDWRERCRTAMDRLVRKSLEMRAVALVI